MASILRAFLPPLSQFPTAPPPRRCLSRGSISTTSSVSETNITPTMWESAFQPHSMHPSPTQAEKSLESFHSSRTTAAESSAIPQIPEVNYLGCFKIRKIPCRVKATPFLCTVNGCSETVQIVRCVRLVDDAGQEPHRS